MCELLRYHSKAEVARRLGLSESTLKDRIKRLRPVFQKLGLAPPDVELDE